MNAHRRTALKSALQLETLDERIAPAHLGIAAASDAAVAHHHIAVHTRAVAHVHSSEMHANTARLAAMARASTGGVIGSTLPATLTSHHAATTPPSPVTVAPPAPTTATPPITVTAPPTPTGSTSSTPSSSTLPASLPANVDGNLNTIYQQYLQYVDSGSSGSFSSSLSNLIQIQGTSVGVEVHGDGKGDFTALVSSLESMGMQISATDSVTQTVAGMLPIADLPAAAQGLQTLSVTPQYLPKLR